MKSAITLFAFTSLIFLSACGGGGGSGDIQLVTVDDTNADNVADSAVQASSLLFESSDSVALPLDTSFGSSPSTKSPGTVFAKAALTNTFESSDFASGLVIGETIEGTCGGSVNFVGGEQYGPADYESGSISAEVEYNDFCVSSDFATIITDGFFDIEMEWFDYELVSFSAEYDLSITQIIEEETTFFSQSGSIVCSDVQSDICTSTIFESEFPSADGTDTFTVVGPVISGDEISGYDYSAIITSDLYGSYEIVGTNLVPSTLYPGFDSGTLEIIDSSGEVVIFVEFGVGEYSVTFDGETEIYYL